VDQSKTFEVRITQPSPQSSPMTLVSWRRTAPWNSNGKIGSGGAKYERGMKKRHFEPLPVLYSGGAAIARWPWRYLGFLVYDNVRKHGRSDFNFSFTLAVLHLETNCIRRWNELRPPCMKSVLAHLDSSINQWRGTTRRPRANIEGGRFQHGL